MAPVVTAIPSPLYQQMAISWNDFTEHPSPVSPKVYFLFIGVPKSQYQDQCKATLEVFD